jgi:hypothetical protein
MFSPSSSSGPFHRSAQDGRIDRDVGKRKDLGPSLAYSPSAVLFLTGPVPFVNEEDFRSPLCSASRHRTIRCGVDLGCNPPLIDLTTAWLCILLSKILSA